MVTTAINTESNPASTNTHQLMVIRYGYACNQLFIAHQASGKAISAETTINFKKSADNNVVMPVTHATTTLRIPNSIIHRTAV